MKKRRDWVFDPQIPERHWAFDPELQPGKQIGTGVLKCFIVGFFFSPYIGIPMALIFEDLWKIGAAVGTVIWIVIAYLFKDSADGVVGFTAGILIRDLPLYAFFYILMSPIY